MDAIALQAGGGLNAFPGGRDLDQHAVDVHALALVQVDDAARARHGGFGIEAQAGVHLGGHTAWDVFQDLAAEAHEQAVHGFVQPLRTVFRHRVLQQMGIVGLLHRLQDERRVGGRVPG
ncbi:hypothetical protein D9M68_741990 [compost metagenome]